MPQGSLITEMELHKVVVTMAIDEIKQQTTVMVTATNRAGAMLSSGSIIAKNWQEAELVPLLLADVAYGFLYRGAKEAVNDALGAFRSRRKSLIL